MNSFSDRLAEGIQRKGTPLCVGIDPRWDMLPLAVRQRFYDGSLASVAEAYRFFGERVIELVAPLVAVVKPQAAFFEACGPAGMSALQAILQSARAAGLITILDGKRNDIASTATAYAEASFGGITLEGQTFPVWQADSLTVNPYLGEDAMEPFIRAARQSRAGLFVLVRTSNPGSGLFQEIESQGRKLFEIVADAVTQWNQPTLGACGLGDIGAVVGATHPKELKALRERMKTVWLLIPGFGAQGGTAADVRAGLHPNGLGAIINSSRGITFPFRPEEPQWEQAIVQATQKTIAELR